VEQRTYVQPEQVRQTTIVNTNNRTSTVVKKEDDDFICSRNCWILTALLGLLLLLLALLYGLGVFGGNANVSTPTV